VGSYTRVDKARSVLGWQAERTVVDGIRDALAWADIRAERLTVG
jgi:UDP-glucose 4-epimerase